MTLLPPEGDAEARKILSALDYLSQNPPQGASLTSWLSAWNKTKLDTQTLWARLLIATYKNANDEVAQAAYSHFMKEWLPRLDRNGTVFATQMLEAGVAEISPGIAARLRLELDDRRSNTMNNEGQHEWELASQFDKIHTNLLIEHDGKEISFSKAYTVLSNTTDRQKRAVLWEKIKRAELSISPQLDELYAQLVELRIKIASEAGAANYAEYAWGEALREYQIDDAEIMFQSIHEIFVQLSNKLSLQQAKKLKLEKLKPWDNVNSNSVEGGLNIELHEYIYTAEKVLDDLDVSFGDVFRDLKQRDALDLTPRVGKSHINTAVHYLSIGRSEILCSLTEGIEGFRSLLHEMGHAIHCHSVSQNQQNTFWDFVGFKEVEEFFAYVFTMLGTLSLLKTPNVNQDQKRQELRRLGEHVLVKLRGVEERLRTELWIYQHQHPVTVGEIDAAYLNLSQNPDIDWTGFEDILAKQWQHRQMYLSSFYNIDYAVAVIAAVLFVHSYTNSPEAAIRRLKTALHLGATQGVSTILKTAGIHFPFSKEQLVTARAVVAQWLD